MGEFVKHVSCEQCGSKDNTAVYADGSTHCFGCLFTVPSKELLDQSKPLSKIRSKSSSPKPIEKEKLVTKESITTAQAEEIKGKTQISAGGYRGISDNVLKFYGVRTEMDGTDNVRTRYYPITVDDKLSGYKVREHPKQFFAIGNTGNDCDLYGAFRFRSGGKYVLLVEGEEDCHAAYQMFREYSESKGGDFTTAVVSITTGAGNPSKQVANNYEFLNNFETIVVGLDNDEAGNKAIDKIISALPKGKVRIATWTKAKDPNKYLENNQQKQFLSDFYNAKTYVPAGVLASDQLYDKMIEQSTVVKMSFPPIMKELNEMLVGGISLGHIYNIAAGTGVGKTSLINEMVYYWIFNSPHMVGILSMELSAPQYAEALFSRHVSRKIAMLPQEEKQEFLVSDRSKELAHNLFVSEEGKSRFYLCEDRDGSIEQLQEVIEQMVISSGCKVIVLDPLQDVLDGLSNDEQAVFLKWAKSMIKSHGIAFIFINHIRKSQSGEKSSTNGGALTEDSIHGSSTIIKSASANILLSRDKYSEDEVERNTTKIVLSKNRLVGLTGPAGELYYENYTHTLHNKEEYFSKTPRPSPTPAQQKEHIDF